MGENICKQCDQQGLNFENIQTVHTASKKQIAPWKNRQMANRYMMLNRQQMLNTANYQRNANQNYNEVSLHSGQDGHHQKVTNNKCWRQCWEKGTLLYYWRECKLVQLLWRTAWRFLKNWKQSCYMIQQSHSWACIWRKPLIWKDACTSVFIAALFTIAKIWKQPKCHSTDEWIKKDVVYICTQWNTTQPEKMTVPFPATHGWT